MPSPDARNVQEPNMELLRRLYGTLPPRAEVSPDISERSLAEAVERLQQQIGENHNRTEEALLTGSWAVQDAQPRPMTGFNQEAYRFQGTETHRIQSGRPNTGTLPRTLSTQGQIATEYGMCKKCKLVHALIHRVGAKCPKCSCVDVAIMFIGASDNIDREGGPLCP